MADFGNIALGLQGFGAGVQGQLPQFQASLAKRQAQTQAMDDKRKMAMAKDAQGTLTLYNSGDIQGADNLLTQRIDMIGKLGGDPQDTIDIQERLRAGDPSVKGDLETFVGRATAAGYLQAPDPMDAAKLEGQQLTNEAMRRKAAGGGEQPAGTVEFENLIADFTPEQQKDARLVKAGLKGRTVSNAILGAIASGTLTNLAEAEGQIAQAKKFGAMTGSSRASTIDKGFERIVKIDAGIGNIDKAIEAVQGGAGVGVIQSKFPSLRAASVALDQIQKSMALDVIGAVTFGALSKGELDLAREVALPVGMEGPALIAHLNSRKAAQTKLRGYFNDQIQHLDQGGTVASFMRKMEREPQGQQPDQGAPAANIIRFDAQGNQI